MSTTSNALKLKVVWDGNDDGLIEATNPASPSAHWTSITRANVVVYLLLPLFALAALTIGIRSFHLDLKFSGLFFDSEAGYFSDAEAPLWMALYRFGPLPGVVLGIWATVMLVGSFVIERLRLFREPCMFLALMLALGPGLLVNGILKPSWNRPRPCELTEFGGTQDFLPVLNLRLATEHVSKSFPSGHASIGFYLLAPIFVLSDKSRRWSILFLMLGLSLGFAMGLGRVAQGRHFASDVLWSGAIVYFTGLVLAYVLRPATKAIQARTAASQLDSGEGDVLRLDDFRPAADSETDESETRIPAASDRRAA